MKSMKPLTKSDISHIIEMAWCDDTSFEMIEHQTGITETEVIRLMRSEITQRSFKKWRARVSGRQAKHSRRSANIAVAGITKD